MPILTPDPEQNPSCHNFTRSGRLTPCIRRGQRDARISGGGEGRGRKSRRNQRVGFDKAAVRRTSRRRASASSGGSGDARRLGSNAGRSRAVCLMWLP